MMPTDDLAKAISALRASTTDAERDDVDGVLALSLRSSLHCPTGPHGEQLPAMLRQQLDEQHPGSTVWTAPR